MKPKNSTLVNKTRFFVNKTGVHFVDKPQKGVSSVNKVVNKTKGDLLTPNIKHISGLSPMSTMSTKNIIKVYVCYTYSNSSKTHIYVCARAGEGVYLPLYRGCESFQKTLLTSLPC